MSKIKNTLGRVCEAIGSKKGEQITVLDVRKIASFTDFL